MAAPQWIVKQAGGGSGGSGGSGPVCIGWDVQDSTPGTDVSDPVIPPGNLRIADCRVRIKVSDIATPLEFDIRRNGTTIFSTRPVVPAGTSTRAVQTYTSLATVALSANDDLVLDIITGGTWQVAIYLMAEPEAGGDGGTGGGGSTSPLTTKGDIWIYSTIDDRLPVGSNGQVLTADSAEPGGLKWEDPSTSGVYVPVSREITAGTGLAGGGDLTADRTISVSANLLAGVLGCVIDGGSGVPSTGSKGYLQCPYTGVITGWTILADQAGSAQITVKKGTFADVPALTSIVASLPPVLAGTQKNASVSLAGWTTLVFAGDVLEFTLDSIAICKRLILELGITKS